MGIFDQTLNFKIDLDISSAKAKIQELKADLGSLGATSSEKQAFENATKQVPKGSAVYTPDRPPGSYTNETRSQTQQRPPGSSTADARAQIQRDRNIVTSQRREAFAAPPPRPPGPPPSIATMLFGEGSRGDRGGAPFARVRSVAEYRVANAAIQSVSGAFSKGASVVADVNEELTQLNKILNISKSKLDDLKTSAIASAKEFGLSTKGVLEGYKIFAQQGMEPEEIKKYGRTVSRASNVSEFGTAGLSELVVAAKKLFPEKETGKTGEKLIDTLLKIESKYAVSESDLADVLKRIGAQAAVSGLSVSQLSALTVVMKERTRSPSGEIATSLRFMLKNLQDTKTVTKLTNAFERFGQGNKVKFYEASGDIRNAFDIMKDMSEIYPKLNRYQKTYIATGIGQTRFASKAMALLGGYAQTADVLTIAQTAQGTTFERNAIIMEGLKKQTAKTGAAFEAFALVFGENFVAPAITFLRVTQEAIGLLEKAAGLKLPFFGGEDRPSKGLESAPQDEGISIGKLMSTAAIVGGGKFIASYAKGPIDAIKEGLAAIKEYRASLKASPEASITGGFTKTAAATAEEARVAAWRAVQSKGRDTIHVAPSGTAYVNKSQRMISAAEKLAKAGAGTVGKETFNVDKYGRVFTETRGPSRSGSTVMSSNSFSEFAQGATYYNKGKTASGLSEGVKATAKETVARVVAASSKVGVGAAGAAMAGEAGSKVAQAATVATESKLARLFPWLHSMLAGTATAVGGLATASKGAGSAITGGLWFAIKKVASWTMGSGASNAIKAGGKSLELAKGAGLLAISARSLGKVLGVGATPLGFAASMAITEAIIWGVGRAFESGRGRSERQGLVHQQNVSQDAINASNNLESSFSDLKDINEQLVEYSKPGNTPEDLAAKRRTGELSGTKEQLQEQKKALEKTQKYQMREMAATIAATPSLQKAFKIAESGNIKYDRGGGYYQDLQTLPEEEQKAAIRLVKKQATVIRSTAEVGIALNDLNTNLKDDVGFKLFKTAMEKASARSKAIQEPYGLEKSNKEITNWWGTVIPTLSTGEQTALDLEGRKEVRDASVGGILTKFSDIITNSSNQGQVEESFKKINSLATFSSKKALLELADINNTLQAPATSIGGGDKTKWQQLTTMFREPMSLYDTSLNHNKNQNLLDETADSNKKFTAFMLNQERLSREDKFNNFQAVTVNNSKNKGDMLEILKGLSVGTLVKFNESTAGKKSADTTAVIAENQLGQRYLNIIAKTGAEMPFGITQTEMQSRSFNDLANKVESFSYTKSQPAALMQMSNLSENSIHAGLGTGQLYQTTLKTGATYLNELTDQMVGLLNPARKLETGIYEPPKVNQELQTSFEEAAKELINIKSSIKAGSASPQEKARLVELGSIAVVGKEIEGLGKIIKSLEGVFVKFGQYANQRAAQQEIPVTRTGLLQAFGGVAPQLAFGKNKYELNPQEAASAALPNKAKELESLQTQLNLLQTAKAEIKNTGDTSLKALENASTAELSLIDLRPLNAALSNIVSTSTNEKDKLVAQDWIKKLSPETKAIPEQNRVDFFAPLKDLFLKITSNAENTIQKNSEEVASKSKVIEQTLKVATSFAAISNSAIATAAALESLRINSQPISKMANAMGEGVNGILSPADRPVMYSNKPGRPFSEAQQINFAGKTKYEIEKELLDVLSSREAQNNQIEIFNKEGIKQSPISTREAADRRNILDRNYERERKEEKNRNFYPRLAASRSGLEQNSKLIADYLSKEDLTPDQRKGALQVKAEIDRLLNNNNQRNYMPGPAGEANLKRIQANMNSFSRYINTVAGQDLEKKPLEQNKNEVKEAVNSMMVDATTVNLYTDNLYNDLLGKRPELTANNGDRVPFLLQPVGQSKSKPSPSVGSSLVDYLQGNVSGENTGGASSIPEQKIQSIKETVNKDVATKMEEWSKANSTLGKNPSSEEIRTQQEKFQSELEKAQAADKTSQTSVNILTAQKARALAESLPSGSKLSQQQLDKLETESKLEIANRPETWQEQNSREREKAGGPVYEAPKPKPEQFTTGSRRRSFIEFIPEAAAGLFKETISTLTTPVEDIAKELYLGVKDANASMEFDKGSLLIKNQQILDNQLAGNIEVRSGMNTSYQNKKQTQLEAERERQRKIDQQKRDKDNQNIKKSKSKTAGLFNEGNVSAYNKPSDNLEISFTGPEASNNLPGTEIKSANSLISRALGRVKNFFGLGQKNKGTPGDLTDSIMLQPQEETKADILKNSSVGRIVTGGLIHTLNALVGGFGDEAVAGGAATLDATGNNTFDYAYPQRLADARAMRKEYTTALGRPLSMVQDVVAMALLPFGKAGAFGKGGAISKVVQSPGRSAAYAAGGGAVFGAGETEGGAGNRAIGAGVGAGVGAATGLVFESAAKAIMKGIPLVSKKVQAATPGIKKEIQRLKKDERGYLGGIEGKLTKEKDVDDVLSGKSGTEGWIDAGEGKYTREVSDVDAQVLLDFYDARRIARAQDVEASRLPPISPPNDGSMRHLKSAPSEIYLPDVLKHDTLFKDYPFLKNTPVKMVSKGNYGGKVEGLQQGIGDTIVLHKDMFRNSDNAKETIMHEVTHIIGNYGKRSHGGSPQGMSKIYPKIQEEIDETFLKRNKGLSRPEFIEKTFSTSNGPLKKEAQRYKQAVLAGDNYPAYTAYIRNLKKNATGSNSYENVQNEVNYNRYRNLYAEQQATLVGNRRNMSTEELAAKPFQNEPIDKDSLIYHSNSYAVPLDYEKAKLKRDANLSVVRDTLKRLEAEWARSKGTAAILGANMAGAGVGMSMLAGAGNAEAQIPKKSGDLTEPKKEEKNWLDEQTKAYLWSQVNYSRASQNLGTQVENNNIPNFENQIDNTNSPNLMVPEINRVNPRHNNSLERLRKLRRFLANKREANLIQPQTPVNPVVTAEEKVNKGFWGNARSFIPGNMDQNKVTSGKFSMKGNENTPFDQSIKNTIPARVGYDVKNRQEASDLLQNIRVGEVLKNTQMNSYRDLKTGNLVPNPTVLPKENFDELKGKRVSPYASATTDIPALWGNSYPWRSSLSIAPQYSGLPNETKTRMVGVSPNLAGRPGETKSIMGISPLKGVGTTVGNALNPSISNRSMEMATATQRLLNPTMESQSKAPVYALRDNKAQNEFTSNYMKKQESNTKTQEVAKKIEEDVTTANKKGTDKSTENIGENISSNLSDAATNLASILVQTFKEGSNLFAEAIKNSSSEGSKKYDDALSKAIATSTPGKTGQDSNSEELLKAFLADQNSRDTLTATEIEELNNRLEGVLQKIPEFDNRFNLLNDSVNNVKNEQLDKFSSTASRESLDAINTEINTLKSQMGSKDVDSKGTEDLIQVGMAQVNARLNSFDAMVNSLFKASAFTGNGQ